jgi:hypothetical protein
MSWSNGDTLGRSAAKHTAISGCGRLISCGSHDEAGWRTELELCRRESFDDHHGPAAIGTAPQRVHCRSGCGFRFGLQWNCTEGGEAQRQERGAPSVGEEAEVADADEALGEQVQAGNGAGTHRARGS